MKSVSEKYLEKMQDNLRTFIPRMSIDGVELDGDIQAGLTINLGSCGSEQFAIGNAYIPYITAALTECSTPLQDKEILLEMGLVLDDETVEYKNIGYFTVEKPTTDRFQTSFTAYGRLMSKAGGVYTSNLTYPTTITAVLDEIKAQTGLNIILKGLTAEGTITKPIAGELHREALMRIAGLLGGFVTEDGDGNIVISKYTLNRAATVDTDFCYEYPETTGEAYTITGIEVIVREDGTDEEGNTIDGEKYASDSVVNVRIQNPYMTEELFQACELNIVGFSYMPAKVEFLGDISLEPWDSIVLTDEDAVLDIPCMSITHVWDGGLVTTVTAPGHTETEELSSFGGPMATMLDRVYQKMLVTDKIIAGKVSAEYVDAKFANLDNAYIGRAEVEELVAKKADIDFANIKKGSIKEAMIESAFVSRVAAAEANIYNLTSSVANIEKAYITSADVETLVANKGFITKLATEELLVNYVKAETLSAEYIKASEIDTRYARIGALDATNIAVNTLKGNVAAIEEAYISGAEVGALLAGYVKATELETEIGKFGYLEAANLSTEVAKLGYATVANLNAVDAKFNNLSTTYATVDLANVKKGSITTAMIGDGVVNNAQIADGSITDAKIVGLTANKITAGKLDAAQIEVVNLNAANITVGTINGQQIAAGAIDTTKLTSSLNSTIASASTNASQALSNIDKLQIGGRNLLKNTNVLYSRTNTATSPLAKSASFVDGYDLQQLIGKTVVFSYLQHTPGTRDSSLSTDTGTNKRFGMHGTVKWKDSTGVKADKTDYPFTQFLTATSTNKRVEATFTLTPPAGYDTILSFTFAIQMFSKPAADNTETWQLGYPKLEIGTKATDWTPAPEDVETAVEKAQSTADGKNTVYYQASLPTGADHKLNDIWFDTNDGNKMYYWNSSVWVPQQFGTSAIAANTITANEIAAGAITAAKIAANTITVNEIAAGAITTDELAANAVTTAKLAAGAVTAATIAANAVTTEKIAAGAVVADSIAVDAITSDKIVSEAITSEKIASRTITANKIAVGAISTDELAANAVTTAKLAAGAVVATTIAANAITTDKIASSAITAEKINVTDLFALDITATGSISGLKYRSTGTNGEYAVDMELDAGTLTMSAVSRNISHTTKMSGDWTRFVYDNGEKENYIELNGNYLRQSVNGEWLFKTSSSDNKVTMGNTDIIGTAKVSGMIYEGGITLSDKYAPKSHYHSANDITTAGYLSVHPEHASMTLIPFIHNDLAFLDKKGGSIKYYTTTSTSYTAASLQEGTLTISNSGRMFDGSPSYATLTANTTYTAVIDLSLHKVFQYSNQFYIDFGSANWRAKNISVYVMNSTTETAYTKKGGVTGLANGNWLLKFSHTSTDSSGSTVQGFDRLRIVLSDFNNAANRRIAQIGLVNYGSAGVTETFMSRGGCSGIYGSLIPHTTNNVDLGSSSKKWKNVYATTFTGSLSGNATSATKATQDGAGNTITATYLKLSGGALTGPLIVNGGDGTSASKFVLATGVGQITNSATGTLFGYIEASKLAVGHSTCSLTLRGKDTRPTYNGTNLVLSTDSHTWTSATPTAGTGQTITLSAHYVASCAAIGLATLRINATIKPVENLSAGAAITIANLPSGNAAIPPYRNALTVYENSTSTRRWTGSINAEGQIVVRSSGALTAGTDYAIAITGVYSI